MDKEEILRRAQMAASAARRCSGSRARRAAIPCRRWACFACSSVMGVSPSQDSK